MRFAVVDVETTGGNAEEHRITEIGIVISNGKEILQQYHSLINPERQIPYYITNLTGINNRMTDQAPTFAEVAPEILRHTEGCIFVAHHVDFDYSFVRHEMNRAGLEFKAQKLCTVRYARGLMPLHKGFSLARLAAHFGIQNEMPHRALADALTASHILHRLLEIDDSLLLKKKISALQKETKLPAMLPPEQFHNLPHAPGVYYFYGKDGKPLYIGKAIDLKARVTTHFQKAETSRGQAFMREIYAVKYYETGSELLALIKEDVEIRTHWPKHNSAQKRVNKTWQVVAYSDVMNNIRLAIMLQKSSGNAVRSFASKLQSEQWLRLMVEKFQLNPFYCGLRSMADSDLPVTDELHNTKCKRFIEHCRNQEENIVLREKGRNNAETGFVWMKRGRVYAIGFAPAGTDFFDLESLEAFAEKLYSSPTIEAVVAGYASRLNME